MSDLSNSSLSSDLPPAVPGAASRGQDPSPVPVAGIAERQISLLRYIAAPLLEAVERAPYPETDGPRSMAENATAFSGLVESTTEINAHLVSALDNGNGSVKGRWLSAEAVSAWMAAHYRATGQIPGSEETGTLIDALLEAVTGALSELPGDAPRPAPPSDVLARSLKALAPAAASVARYSFGRNAIDLLVEVTRRLTTTALEFSQRLGAGEGQALLSSPTYFAMLEVAGLFYKQAHRGEMDRLLSMPAEERRAYVRAHDRRVPMDPVWDALDLQLGMLEAMAAHIPVPAPSHADELLS